MKGAVLPSPGVYGAYPGYDVDLPTIQTEKCSWYLMAWMTSIADAGIVIRQDEDTDYSLIQSQTAQTVTDVKQWVESAITAVKDDLPVPQFDLTWITLPFIAGLKSGSIWGIAAQLLINLLMQSLRNHIGGQGAVKSEDTLTELVEKFEEAFLDPTNQDSTLLFSVRGESSSSVAAHLNWLVTRLRELKELLETSPGSAESILAKGLLTSDLQNALMYVLAQMGLTINLNTDQTTIEYGPPQ